MGRNRVVAKKVSAREPIVRPTPLTRLSLIVGWLIVGGAFVGAFTVLLIGLWLIT